MIAEQDVGNSFPVLKSTPSLCFLDRSSQWLPLNKLLWEAEWEKRASVCFWCCSLCTCHDGQTAIWCTTETGLNSTLARTISPQYQSGINGWCSYWMNSWIPAFRLPGTFRVAVNLTGDRMNRTLHCTYITLDYISDRRTTYGIPWHGHICTEASAMYVNSRWLRLQHVKLMLFNILFDQPFPHTRKIVTTE